MTDWNKQAAPNNNLSAKTIRSSKLLGEQDEHEFSEELSDNGERNQIIQQNSIKNRK